MARVIAAFEPCSFVDFPGRLAAVAFIQGCNLRCRYCHNPDLCERKETNPQTTDDFLHFLRRRRDLLTGVVVSGGEPTLWSQLESFLERLRSLGFSIKLDTNGLDPKRTRQIIERGLVDHLAVDIKSSPGDRSRWLCGHARQADLAVRTLTEAARMGVEAVDLCLGRLLPVIQELGGIAIVTADHGNADEMYEVDKKGGVKMENGRPKAKTSHTLNPVPCVIYDPTGGGWQLDAGTAKPGLANVAATALNLMGFNAPEDYERSLVKLG